MPLNSLDIVHLTEINQSFLAQVDEDVTVPIYQCNPATTAETARLLHAAGYICYCPYYMAPVRKNRHTRERVDMPFLFFSGYLFIVGRSPKDTFPDRVSRLRFADHFASVALSDLVTF